jgi:hypothetical protein
VAGLLIASLLLVTACPLPIGPDQQTEQLLQNAIDTLNNQPSLWQTTMQSTIDELGKVGTQTAKDVLVSVQSTYNGALGQTESATFCGVDFLAQRLAQRLQSTLHRFFSDQPDALIIPVVCTTNPADRVTPGATQEVVYYGYDFLTFSSQKSFEADLRYASGNLITANFGHVAIPHNYELTVEFASADWSKVNQALGPQLVLTWGTASVDKSALPVVLPTPTPAPTATPQRLTCGPYGGGGGTSFNEQFGATPTGMTIFSGEFVDSIQMLYATGPGQIHGQTGGGPHAVNFRPGEYIQALSIRSGDFVDAVTIQTNLGSYGPYGGTGGSLNPTCGGAGWQVVGIFGRAGSYLDALGVILQKT